MAEKVHMAHAVKSTKEFIDTLNPLKKKKDPAIAFIVGFFFGAIGLGLYLKSWKDMFLCGLAALALIIVFLPTVVGEFMGVSLGFVLAAIYGAYRVVSSNEKLASAAVVVSPEKAGSSLATRR